MEKQTDETEAETSSMSRDQSIPANPEDSFDRRITESVSGSTDQQAQKDAGKEEEQGEDEIEMVSIMSRNAEDDFDDGIAKMNLFKEDGEATSSNKGSDGTKTETSSMSGGQDQQHVWGLNDPNQSRGL